MEALKRFAAIVCCVLLLGGTSPGVWRSIELQTDIILIDIPTGLLFLPRAGFERADFEIQRANGDIVMRIAGQPGMDPDIADMASATRYCVNGIYGVTLLGKGVRKIHLRLPPEGQQLQYYFEFSEHDRTARAIMKTFRIRGLRRRCVSNYAGGPQASG